MPRKSEIRKTTLLLSPDADAALRKVSAELRLNQSDTIRFLVFEKCRALGLDAPRPAANDAAPETVSS